MITVFPADVTRRRITWLLVVILGALVAGTPVTLLAPLADKQSSVLHQLAAIAEDAQSFEEETGAHVLHLGFPLLSLPPEPVERPRLGLGRRILAPVAFVPVTLAVQEAQPATVELRAFGERSDRVVPNAALLDWVERRTGARLGDLLELEEGASPWRELHQLVAVVARALELAPPSWTEPGMALAAAPRSDDEDAKAPSLLPSAVLGLFPPSSQGLIHDLEALAGGEPVSGPLRSFVDADTGLAHAPGSPEEGQAASLCRAHAIAQERLVCGADPCQARAVRLARLSRGLVIRTPPGTGKSQTIANIIGDHLARGERVLLVCGQRAALDAVV